MKKYASKRILIDIILIIAGIILFWTGNYRWALFLITLSLLGICWNFYTIKKNIKPFDKGWSNKYIIFLTSWIISIRLLDHFLFNKKFEIYSLIFAIPILFFAWWYSKYLEKNWTKMQAKPKRKIGLGEILFITFIVVLLIGILFLS